MSLSAASEEENREVVVAELQPDAMWKKIQQNTFTRWVNQQLKCVDISIDSLEIDFEDGLKLIRLIEVLSGKLLGKYSKRVTFRSQKLENISLALNFLENEEHIKIVNIDSSAIADGNIKLILGLVWTLILHYSISKQVWEGIPAVEDEQVERSPKQKLLTWIKAKIPPGLPLNNFTSDWNDGVLLGALVESCAPDIHLGWRDWLPSEALKSTRTAMKAANDCLDVAPLITPEELINPAVDEKSVMTYLAQFPQARYQPPLGRVSDVELTPIVSATSTFVIHMANASIIPEVAIIGPNGSHVEHQMTKSSPVLYQVSYRPNEPGDHEISVTAMNSSTGETKQISSQKVTAVEGARLVYSRNSQVGLPALLRVENAVEGVVEAVVVDAKGRELVLPMRHESAGVYVAEFVPECMGLHSINVFMKKKHIAGSPFPLNVQSQANFKVWGRGIVSDGVRVGDEVFVHADADAVCTIPLGVRVRDPSGQPLAVSERFDEGKLRSSFIYKPQREGDHIVEVKVGDELLGRSPYKVPVAERTNCAVRAFGSGVEGGVAKLPCIFYVETNGDTDELGFSIEGPSKTDIICTDNGDGSAVVQYTPEEPGVYQVNVMSCGKHIKDSPFVLMVDPANDKLKPSSVRVLGIEQNTRALVGDSLMFRVDTSEFSQTETPASVKVLDANYVEVPVNVMRASKGTYECSFSPEVVGRHYVIVSAGGIAVPGSPFILNVREHIDPSVVRVYGPGVGSEVRSQQPTHFFIDAKGAGPGEVEVSLCDREGTAVDVDVLDNNDGSFTVKYTAPRPGAYQLDVVFAGVEIPRIGINVKPHLDVSGIRVEGLENETVLIGHRQEIRVDTGNLVAYSDGLQVIAEDPDGQKYLLKLTQTSRGTHTGAWTAQKFGETKFAVFFDDFLVCESKKVVREGEDASKCRAYGDGLERAYVGEPARFRIETQGAGEGSVAMCIKGPSESKTSVLDHSDGSCTVEYVPLTPGLYEINITYGEKKEPIPGSPFTAEVDYSHDPSRIVVSDFKSSARVGQPFTFTVDASRTAAGNIDARLPVGQQQPIVREIEPRVYRVSFTPSGKVGDVLPLELLYSGEPFRHRPLSVSIGPEVEPELVKLRDRSGGSIPADTIASLPARYLIDTRDAGLGNKLVAEVKGPDGKLRKSTLTSTSDLGVYALEFIPDIAGVYDVRIFINDLPTSSQPYKVRALPTGDANKCIIKGLPTEEYWAVGETKKFAVDVSEAGTGALCVLPSREYEVAANVEASANGKDQTVSLTPLTTGPHIVGLLYGGKDIPNGSVRFECLSPAQMASREEGTFLARTEEFDEGEITEPPQPRSFKFALEPDLEFSKLTAIVTMPSGKHDFARIEDNHDRTVTVTYHPSQYGKHQLAIEHDGVNMVGSPISFFVERIKDGAVSVYGPGLSHAVVGEPANFTVCAKSSSAKELSVAVEGTAKATIKCHDNKDGTCSVAWVPPVPGEYKVHVKLAGKPVKDSPFTVLVAGEGQKRAHLSVGSTSEVSLNIVAPELKGLSATIKSPLGIEEPCFIRQIDPSHIGVSFTPREEGEHWITVKRNDVLLPKSPFRVRVDKSQVGDASKVVVTGPGRSNAVCQQFNDISVDTRNAGFGGLSVSVEGPSKCELNCKEAKNGLINVSYRPTEPGIYTLSVKFADQHVRDSPFTVVCTGTGIGAVKESIIKEAQQASMVMPGQDANLFLQLTSTSPTEVTAKVMNPKGQSEDVEIRDLGNNFYQIRFKPVMEGPHAVSIFHKDQHVNGSPFQFTVGVFREEGAHKVRAGGIGLSRAETNVTQSFNIYTREAGKGKLSVSIEGPSKAELQFHDHKDGNCHVDYKVSAPGVYIISITFNDEHIPDSPFKVFVAPSTGEARRLELVSFPESILPGKSCAFTVLTHGAVGRLEAEVQTPSNDVEAIDIVPMDGGKTYALRFVPHEIGNYFVDVTLDGAPMRDSPFRLRVGPAEGNDPTAITASGEGLHRGETGQKCEFIIDTCNAGCGLLQVQIDGPSKVTLDAYEVDVGYKVRYMALLPGVYYAAIKYSGIHIPGSPFKINIDGKELCGTSEPDSAVVKIDALAKTNKGTIALAPVYTGDARKVTVKGSGMNKFIPGRPAEFNIETGLAGPNLLFVGIVTTKGPCEEVNVKHVGGGSYVVQYRIQDRVKGFIFVKYGDEQVPGSPFEISY